MLSGSSIPKNSRKGRKKPCAKQTLVNRTLIRYTHLKVLHLCMKWTEMQFISDTWLSTLIGILATILVAIVIFRMQRKRKEIAYEVISDTSVLNVEEDMISK